MRNLVPQSAPFRRSPRWGYALALVCVVAAVLALLAIPNVYHNPIFIFLLAAVAVAAWFAGPGAGLVKEALRESETSLRTVFDSVYDGILIHTADGKLIDVNRRCLAMYGVTLGKLSNLSVSDISSPSAPVDKLPSIWAEVLAGRPQFFEWKARRPHDGGEFDVEVFLRSVQMKGRGVIMANIRDITERKLAMEKLRTSETRFRELTENIPQLVWTAGAAGNCDFVSERWLEYTGATIGETLQNGWRNVIHPDDHVKAREAWEHSMGTGNDYQAEYRLRRSDGAYRWHLAHGVPIRDESGNVLRWFGTTTDIEEQKRAQQVLIQSEKLASVGRMAATVAHEINNPLETVMNAVYLAWSDPSLSPEARRQLETAEQELERVAHITRQTLGFYRETGKAVEIVLPDLVDSVLDIYTSRLRNNDVSLRRDYAPVRIVAVPGEVKQIVSNLIANGIDAIGRGGTLHIRAAMLPGANGRRLARLTIADSGSGIAPEHVPRIYEPFFTTKEAIGTGLGLWVSSQLVKKYGGSIRMRSRPGCGTVFAVYFPAAAGFCAGCGAA